MCSSQAQPPLIRFGVFEADLRAGELRRNGAKVRLQDLPFRALTLLLSRPGEVISRQEFREALWPPDVFVDFEQGISSAVMRLRDALRDSAENPIFIETIERRGYRWIGPTQNQTLQPLSHGTPEVVTDLPSISLPDTAGNNHNHVEVADAQFSETRKPEFTASYQIELTSRGKLPSHALGSWLVLGVIASVSVTGFFLWGRQRPDPISSIAILPFDNLSAPAFDDAFSDGLTDEVASSISQLPGVHVAGRRSAYVFKGKHDDLRDIGARLNVEAVVEGSVQHLGDRTHVTVQMSRTRDGFTVWSQTYDGTTADWFQIESQIANSISRNLARQVMPETGPHAAPNPEAHALYLEARYLWNQRNYPGLLKSVDLLHQATTLDPNYALAWAGLADSLIAIGDVEEVDPAAYLPRARDSALRALQLDSSLAEAHAALGMIACHYDYDWPAAEREYKKALELNTSYPSAHQYYALGLMAHGRFAEAETQLNIARQLDPLALVVDVDTALLRKYQHDYDGVIATAESVVQRDPNSVYGHAMLTTGYYCAKRWDDWRADETRFPQDDAVTRALANGREDQELQELDKSIARAKAGLVRPSYVVRAANRMRKRALALEWLEKSFAHHDYWELFINVDPEFDWLHSEPRFQALVHNLGVG